MYAGGERTIIRPNGNRELVMSNHLGSTACIFPLTGVNNTPIAQQVTDAYGIPLTLQGAVDPQRSRTSFIGRDVDKESDLGAFGARLYSSKYGRFVAVDKLWEEFYPYTQYHYVQNRPVQATDVTGLNEYYDVAGNLISSDDNTQGNFIITATGNLDDLLKEGKAFKAPTQLELNQIERKILYYALQENNNDCTKTMREFGGVVGTDEVLYEAESGPVVPCGGDNPSVKLDGAVKAVAAAEEKPKYTIHTHPNPNASPFGN